MTKFARAIRYFTASPDKILTRITKAPSCSSTKDEGKIIVDEYGNLSLNPNNKEIQEYFRANVKAVSEKYKKKATKQC
ncbi:hypothetical protein [Xenorhabdus ishibashii]|uniref:Uncharacterized protein n=1 Tax=Xenorhabdus ishibashii TaxID=1034471 RepID=A0A2D0KCP4_9GAMM|nr:hypothetical protein [Xenorhabdus ishibashii]PHM61216.1 hypothetical protein Xish_00338 [Xenorhabdus ishibashii]